MRIPALPAFRFRALAAAIIPLLAFATASAQCPGGSGTPITITNLKAGETLGHDLVLLKGAVAAGTQQVSISAGGETLAWPAGGGVYKGFVRLKPGANKVVVTSPGHQNACIDLTYTPNPFANRIQLAVILPKDPIEGAPVLTRFPAGEPADLASVRKRIAFAALMQQALIADLLGKAGKARLAPHIVRDAAGEPEVLVWNTDKTKAQLESGQSAGVYEAAMAAIKPNLDGRTRFQVFYANVPGVFNLTDGTLTGLDNAYAWPQDLGELISRWTDRRSPKDLAVPGALTDTVSLASRIKSDYGFWFKLCGLWALKVPNVDTVTNEPFGKAFDKLNTLFLAKSETGADLVQEPYALTPGTANALVEGGWLAHPNPARAPALAPSAVPGGLVQGASYKYYEGAYDKLPLWSTIAPVASGVASAGFDIQNRTRDENFGFVFDAYLKVPQGGSYLFRLVSDDGSRLLINGQTLIENDGIHVVNRLEKGIALEAGLHRIQVQYFNKAGDRGLNVLWAHAGAPMPQPIPASALQTEPAPIAIRAAASFAAPRLRKADGFAHLSLTADRSIVLWSVDPAGRKQGEIFRGPLAAGAHRIALTGAAASGRDALVLEVLP